MFEYMCARYLHEYVCIICSEYECVYMCLHARVCVYTDSFSFSFFFLFQWRHAAGVCVCEQMADWFLSDPAC